MAKRLMLKAMVTLPPQLGHEPFFTRRCPCRSTNNPIFAEQQGHFIFYYIQKVGAGETTICGGGTLVGPN